MNIAGNIVQPYTIKSGNSSITYYPRNPVYSIKDGQVKPVGVISACPTPNYYQDYNQNINYENQNNIVYNFPSYQSPTYYPKPAVVYLDTTLPDGSGYEVNATKIPTENPFELYAGEGILFERLPDGIKINNNGVRSLDIRGKNGSGIIAVNVGTFNKPNYEIGINKSDLVSQIGIVSDILFNGVLYSPQNGQVVINTGVATISSIQSPNNTVLVSPLSLSTVGLSVRPIKVNSVDVVPASTGNLFNLQNGDNTNVEASAGNIKVNVPNNSFAKQVNGQSPDTNGNVALQIAKQAYIGELTSTQVSNIRGSNGLNLIGEANVLGNSFLSLSPNDIVMLYIEDKFIPPSKYTRTNSSITNLDNNVSVSAGNTLTWLIIKTS